MGASARSRAVACLAFLAGPAMAVPPEGPAGPAVAGRTWELVRIQMMDGTAHLPDEPARYTLRLAEGGRAEIRADCNRATASYALAGAP